MKDILTVAVRKLETELTRYLLPIKVINNKLAVAPDPARVHTSRYGTGTYGIN